MNTADRRIAEVERYIHELAIALLARGSARARSSAHASGPVGG